MLEDVCFCRITLLLSMTNFLGNAEMPNYLPLDC